MRRKINILHIFGRMERGGAEMRTLELMRNVDRERYGLHFCTLSKLPGALDDEIRTLGGEIHPCALGLSFPNRFRRLLRSMRFDVVHSHVHYFSGYILRLAAKERVPARVAHFRSGGDGHSGTLRRVLQRRLMRYWIDRYATSILAVSEGAMASSWGPKWVTDPRCQVIYNGLDLSAFEKPLDLRGVLGEFKLPEDSHLYIHVGSMSPAKNHLRLISIFSTILRHEPMARLILVGRGNNGIEQRVRSWVEELGISDQVVFAGERHDVPRLLKAADMMLFPSLREGLPGVVLEACAAGTPVLASDLPGVREIAAHLPLVHYLSLNASDEEWALEACRIFGSYVRDIDKEMGIRNFADSVFGMTRCVEAQCSIWQTGRTGLEA